MLKKLFVLFAVLSAFGCAHHKHNTVGGMHNDLETGLTVYHQYHLTTSNYKDGEVIYRNETFPADLNVDLPSNIVKLELAMAIVNPYKQQFEIWERVNYIDLENQKLFFKAERHRYTSKMLKEEILSLELPIVSKQPCQVLLTAYVKNDNGEIVYTTYSTKYTIGKQQQ